MAAAAALLLVTGGCRLFVSLDDLSNGIADAGSRDTGAIVVDGASPSLDAGVPGDTGTDAPVDAGPVEGGIVACQKTPSCPTPEQACCIVYDNAEDFCVDRTKPSDCKFGTSKTVLLTCDDDTDCALLGMPNTVCCATTESVGGPFQTIACVPAASCSGFQLCDSLAKKCPPGRTCSQGGSSANTWECH
jgi:hypothetical protein